MPVQGQVAAPCLPAPLTGIRLSAIFETRVVGCSPPPAITTLALFYARKAFTQNLRYYPLTPFLIWLNGFAQLSVIVELLRFQNRSAAVQMVPLFPSVACPVRIFPQAMRMHTDGLSMFRFNLWRKMYRFFSA